MIVGEGEKRLMPKVDTSQSAVQYYETEGSIIACLGPLAVVAMLRMSRAGGPERQWELIHPQSPEFDYFHQYIFRNLKASSLEQGEQENLPPLPKEITYEECRCEDFYGPSAGLLAIDYPALQKAVLDRADQSCPIFAVLNEDTYETSVGDGRYLYLDSAFLMQIHAENRISQIDSTGGYRGHLRKMTLALADGHITIPDFRLEIFDHYGAKDVLDKLNCHLSGNHSEL